MKTHFYIDEIINICEDKHLTVEEIFEQIKINFQDAWKSTIYRNVEQLAKKWILKKVIWVWKKAYFEKDKWNHIHLIDLETWKITDLDEKIQIKLPEYFDAKSFDIKIFWTFK